MTPTFFGLLNSDAGVAIGLAILFFFLALFSRHLLSILGAAILAAVAVLVWLIPTSTPIIIATGCAAGSVLVLWIGRRLRIDRQALQRDLLNIAGKVDAVGSQNTLTNIRLAELKLGLERSNGAQLVPDGPAQFYGHIEGEVRGSELLIGERAEVVGNIIAQEVIIRGRIKGTIRAVRVKLQASGAVEGDIFHRSLSIEESALFEGSSRRVENPIETAAKGPDKPRPQLVTAEGVA
jgi:cytoskeletal protein CcmA (bactofilin family)